MFGEYYNNFCAVIYSMMLGFQGQEADASLLARGFLTLELAKNMRKQSFFGETWADYLCF